MTSQRRPLIVIAGVGHGLGTGGATARLFAQQGYRVALIARGAEKLKHFADELSATGAEAAAFPVESYGYHDINNTFAAIKTHKWPSADASELRVALYNAGVSVRKPFLENTEKDLRTVTDTNFNGAFAFSYQTIQEFKKNELNDKGKRGTLLFTGATGSLRGNITTSAFSAGKFAMRSLSQSLSKEFGSQNIHVAHLIIDGPVLTDFHIRNFGEPFKQNVDGRLEPDSVAMGYLYLVNQDRSAWTWELDMRPAHEKW